MAEENSILFRASMEGADSVIQSVNAIGRAAEAAGERMRSAFQRAASINLGQQMIPRRHVLSMLGEIPRGFIAGPLESSWRSTRANIEGEGFPCPENRRKPSFRRYAELPIDGRISSSSSVLSPRTSAGTARMDLTLEKLQTVDTTTSNRERSFTRGIYVRGMGKIVE